MEITSKHRERATALTQKPDWRIGDAALLLTRPLHSVVATGYLAAVERIDDSGERPEAAGDGYDLAAYTPEGLVWVEATGTHLDADSARAMADELRVLADLAEGESGT